MSTIPYYSIEEIDFSVFDDTTLGSHYNKQYNERIFLQYFFAPWTEEDSSIDNHLSELHFKANDWEQHPNHAMGNYHPFSLELIKTIQNNLPKANVAWVNQCAISTETTYLRKLPTNEFFFKNARHAGEGYPFDYFQESSLWIGTPLWICQSSMDKRWYFVKSPYGAGWVLAQHLTLLTQKETAQWIEAPKVVVTKDNLILQSNYQAYQLKIGTLLPLDADQNLLVPCKNPTNTLYIDRIPMEGITDVHTFPLKFNSTNVKQILGELINKKYSWGGLGGSRDCSAILKDYFMTFGIWLPRNSRPQSQTGQVIKLEGTNSHKRATIQQKAIPFLSSLYKKGHIMLYVGTDSNNSPLIFHAVWGVKVITKNSLLHQLLPLKDQLNLSGFHQDGAFIQTRYVIGKSTITSLEPGDHIDLPVDTNAESFIEKMERLTLHIE